MASRFFAIRLFRGLCAICLAASMAAPALAAGQGWRELDAAHYRVISQLDDQQTVAWAHDFDQFIATTSDLLRIDTEHLAPLTVLLFASGQELAPYQPAAGGAPMAGAGSEFVRKATWNVAGIAAERLDEAARQQFYHDATLWLLSADESRQPAWFVAGMAEQLSTFGISGKRAQWAKPNDAYVKTLHDNDNAYKLRDFLARPAALFEPDNRSDLFHAQAWGFTHFMLYSGRSSLAKQAAQFLTTFKTHSGEATVDDVFGKKLDDIELEFHRYITRQKFGSPSAPLKAAPALPAAGPATPEAVETASGLSGPRRRAQRAGKATCHHGDRARRGRARRPGSTRIPRAGHKGCRPRRQSMPARRCSSAQRTAACTWFRPPNLPTAPTGCASAWTCTSGPST